MLGLHPPWLMQCPCLMPSTASPSSRWYPILLILNPTTTLNGALCLPWFLGASISFLTSWRVTIRLILSGPRKISLLVTGSTPLSDNPMDMCLQLHKPTAREIWVHLENLFTGNKPSRAVHMECELHNFVQGDLSANAYCHCLQQLANSLTDCDAPIQDRALVHQLIRGLNPKFSVIKTMLPLPLPPPSFRPSLKPTNSFLARRRLGMPSPSAHLRLHCLLLPTSHQI
jgi:hypothetical protein